VGRGRIRFLFSSSQFLLLLLSSRLRELHAKLDVSGLDGPLLELVRDLHVGGRKLIAEGPVRVKLNDKMLDVQLLLLSDLLLLTVVKEDKYRLLSAGRDTKKLRPAIIIGSVMARAVATDTKSFFIITTSTCVGHPSCLFFLLACLLMVCCCCCCCCCCLHVSGTRWWRARR
jgi:hypothetical protein